MDNTTQEINHKKCQMFNKLYHGNDSANFKISDSYMCPDVGQSIILEKDSCFAKNKLLGQNHICDKDNISASVKGKINDKQLNQISKASILDHYGKLSKNPDFTYATNLITQGAGGLKKYYMQKQMSGGGIGGNFGSLFNMIENFATVADQTKDVLINKLTIGELLDMVVNRDIGADLIKSADSIKNTCKFGQILDSIGNTRIDNLLEYSNQPILLSTINKFNHSGGMLYKLINEPIYDETQYFNQIMELFDNIKLVVNDLGNTCLSNLIESRAPKNVINDVVAIQKGVNICVQMLRYQILNKKKNNLQ